MSYPPGENSGYQGDYYFNGFHVYSFLHLLKTLIAIDYRQETAPHGYAGGFTAPHQQPHPDVQTIYGQTQNPGSWHHQSFDEATEYASRETGHDKSMFSSLLSSVMSGQQQHEQAQPHEIEQARAAHQKLYGGGGGNTNLHQDDIASAAAMQAVERSESSSGGLQSVIGMAMSEVTKLMGKQGGGGTAGYGNTQQGGGSSGQSDMVKKAVSMAIKLYASKQAGSAVAGQSGGGSSGNPLGSVGGMMNMFLGGGGSKPSSSQGHDQPPPPTQQSHYSQPPSSGYAPPQSHQGGGGGQNYSSPLPSNQGYGGYSQPPSYSGQQQQLYGEQQGYGQQQHHQQQQSYGEQQGYGQQQQSYHGDQQGYGHQQQQQPYEGQQQQQQKPSGGGIEAVAANLLSKFLK